MDIKRLVFNGSIPLKITLSNTESSSWDQTTPYYMEIPRISYLPVYLERLIEFFRRFLLDEGTASAENAWFSTAEVRRYGPMALRDVYMNKLKEADFLRCGSAKRVMSLSKHDSDALWQSVVHHDLDTFTRITNTLLPTTPRNLPIRIYLPTPGPAAPSSPTTPTPGNPHPSSTPSTSSVGPPLNTVHQPLTPSMPSQTLHDLVSSHFSALFPGSRRGLERVRSKGNVLAKAMVHGVEVPGDMPLVEVVREMAGADGWVDVVVVVVVVVVT
ncbi:hypothetical protein YB2330_003940 [Saitoella coloradoensis]